MDLIEIFSSIQGEGPHVGRPTLFVRLGACDLRCVWCDSAHTWRPTPTARVESQAGSGEFEELDNPVGLADVSAVFDRIGGPAQSLVSITGGEPLLQPDAVRAIALDARRRGWRVHLETHGLAVDALAEVIDCIDVVSMDWKLESDVRWADKNRREPFSELHERFLSAAGAAADVHVKVIVTPNTRDAELEEVCRRIESVDPKTPLILQPVTPTGGIRERPSAERLHGWLRLCSQWLPDVRVIPQTHPLYGAL